MNTKFVTASLLVAMALSPLAGRADRDSDRSHPMAYVADSAITTKVKAKLANEKLGSLAHIHVDTDAQGAVYLSGNARTTSAADKAVEIARGTEGVTSVKSSITVKKDD